MSNNFGITNVLDSIAALVAPTAVSTEDWLNHYVDHLTSVDSATTRC